MLKNFCRPLLAVCALLGLPLQQCLPATANRFGLRAGLPCQHRQCGKEYFAPSASAH